MAYELRPYQRGAVDAAIDYLTKCVDPCLLELATGAGKSLIVAEIAKWLGEKSGKKVLCLAPSKELVEQNRAKYLEYGLPASIFSASAGGKDLRHQVVFGSPQTVANSLDRFQGFAAVVIDEAHGITSTVKKIIQGMRELNPRLRVVGLTATPYRLNTGYIYEMDEHDNPVPDWAARKPFFKKLLYRVTADFLIDLGYLTQPVADIRDGYDTSGLEQKGGSFTSESVERAFEGHGRKTAEIVSQVVGYSAGRMGVMIFAATIEHAQEIMASLPPENARLITGDTKKRERVTIIDSFKRREFKYLVNVAVLTTGFDAPHVDVIAILRATESAGLLQQIIGRGLRLHDDKRDCLILDYAENIERHKLEDNLFEPEIKAIGGGSKKITIPAKCALCGTVNEFSGRPNPDEFEHDEEGYFIDLAGNRIMIDGQPKPAHFGRRCFGQTLEKGHFVRCEGRWSFKACPECDTENDIAAKKCTSCKAELIDPNEKLQLDFKRMKKSPHEKSSDRVVGWYCQKWVSQKGNETLRVDWTTDYRTFSVWYSPNSKSAKGQYIWANLSQAVFGEDRVAPTIDAFIDALKKGHGTKPETITSKKQGDFFEVFEHNAAEDKLDDV